MPIMEFRRIAAGFSPRTRSDSKVGFSMCRQAFEVAALYHEPELDAHAKSSLVTRPYVRLRCA